MRQQLPAVFLVTVVRCQGLASSGGSTNPYVWVAATGPEGDATVCLTKTPVVKDSRDPEFNSALILGGVTGVSTLVFTVCDSDLLTTDDFLGQVRYIRYLQLMITLASRLRENRRRWTWSDTSTCTRSEIPSSSTFLSTHKCSR